MGFLLPRSLTVEPMFRKVACIFIDRLRSMRRTDSSMNLHHYQSERLWQGECLRGLTVPLVDQTNQIVQKLAEIRRDNEAAQEKRHHDDMSLLTLFQVHAFRAKGVVGFWSAPVNHAGRYLSVRIKFAISGSFRSFDRFCSAQPNKVCVQASLICSVKLQYIFIRSLVAWGTVNSRFDAPMELVSDELGNFASELGMSHAILVRPFFLFDHGNTVFVDSGYQNQFQSR